MALWIVRSQAVDSKAKRIDLFPLLTGGSWKKSPVTTTYAIWLIRKTNKNAKVYSHLNASEWFIGSTFETTTNRSQLIEKFTVDHRD